MVKDYLITLKKKGNFSWSDLSTLSGLPDTTIRKIFSGETADPRFETVMKLVVAMGGSMDELVNGKKEEEIEANAIIALKEVYEARITDIKESAVAHTNLLQRDKFYLTIISCILGGSLFLVVLLDLLIGSMGWIRY